MRLRIALVVTAVWVIVGVVMGAQATLGASLQGSPIPLSDALQTSLIQALPWVPVTLAVIAITVRYPISRATLPRYGPIHLLAAIAVAFIANVLVVLGFWLTQGQFNGVSTLVRQGALWTTMRLHIALLTYAAIAGLTQIIIYYRDARAKELHLARLEGQLARARLQALNAQIRPHFLFNTLHTIGQLWRAGRSEDADAVLDHLGNLFHKVQHSTTLPEVPLADELELVREYLAIEQVRFRDRMRASVTASPHALECLVPPLLLQPLVENAVRHGISVASSAGTIDVRASVDDGRLVVTVADDGPGFDVPSPRAGEGTGLTNTRERLEQLYGTRATLTTSSRGSRGATVVVSLPVRHAEGNDG
jgi:two-component system, LytTR family, sensor kinase